MVLARSTYELSNDFHSYFKAHEALLNAIGVYETLLLRIIHDYCKLNAKRKNENYYQEGYYWTSLSCRTLAERFPFLKSEPNVRRLIRILENQEILISDNFNKTKADRTKWYRPNFPVIDRFFDTEPNYLEDDLDEADPQPDNHHPYSDKDVDPQPDNHHPYSDKDVQYNNKLINNKLTNKQSNQEKKDDVNSSSFATAHLSDSQQNDVEPNSEIKLNTAPCEAKKSVRSQENNLLNSETNASCGQGESLQTPRIDLQEPLNPEPIQKGCSMLESKARDNRKGDINEYAKMKNKNRVGVNQIDLATRTHLIADIRALNASKLPNYQKAELALLNERFCAFAEKRYVDAYNLSALVASQWEQAIAVYLVGMEKEEKEKKRREEAIVRKEQDDLLRQAIEAMPERDLLSGRLDSLGKNIKAYKDNLARFREKGLAKMVKVFEEKLARAIAERRELQLELQGGC